MEVRIVCTCAGSLKPGFTFRSAMKVRIISAELTSSTRAMATCAMTSTLRERFWVRLLLDVRFEPERESDAFVDAYLIAGIAPKNKAESTDRKTVNMSERSSNDTSLRRGSWAGPNAFNNVNPP